MNRLKSCVSKEPFTKLDENGKASILNYSLPQSTCYDATSFLGLDVNSNLFKANQKRQPSNDYWDYVQNIPKEELLQQLEVNAPLLLKVPLVQNYEVVTSPALGEQKDKGAASNLSVERTAATQNDKSYLADRIKEGYMPVLKRRLSGRTRWVYLPKPKQATPQINIVLHLKMCSFLGNYGAGRTLKTFSLLPGEKTSITIRSYQHQKTVKNSAQNVLDSYSESSAEDLQTGVEHETEHATNLSKTETYSKTGNWKAGANVGVNLGFIKVGVEGGGSGTNTKSTSVNEAIQTQVGILVNSTTRHTSKADSLREIEVNTSTTSTAISETEETIVRELENINKSRVLNFVFRQLLQEFISVTYLQDVSFVYSTGFPTQRKSCKLSGLEGMLQEILVDENAVETVKNQIYTQLCSIVDYNGEQHSLIEKVTQTLTNCITPELGGERIEYVRVRKDLEQIYEGRKVKGIILDATHRVLRTPSVVVDALLGQGEALDCYNQKLQEAATYNAQLENTKLEQALKLIESIENPLDRAKLYQYVFGNCCDTPQAIHKS